jgi:hypothetical protein
MSDKWQMAYEEEADLHAEARAENERLRAEKSDLLRLLNDVLQVVTFDDRDRVGAMAISYNTSVLLPPDLRYLWKDDSGEAPDE